MVYYKDQVFWLIPKLQDRFADLHIIASGGVSELKDIIQLNEMNVSLE